MDVESNISNGQITSGITLRESVLKIINFISVQLPFWRDDPVRIDEQAESRLNTQLSKFLNYRAREYFPMFRFDHEEPQEGIRSLDISVSPGIGMVIEARIYTIYDPVLVIECKRLPAPKKEREKEYVSSLSPDKKSGGIQRFKLGLHGKQYDLAVMIGYIQKQINGSWLETINKWIKELVEKPIGDGCVWADDEMLYLLEDDAYTGVIKCNSTHRRTANNGKIEIRHLWIVMRKKSA